MSAYRSSDRARAREGLPKVAAATGSYGEGYEDGCANRDAQWREAVEAERDAMFPEAPYEYELKLLDAFDRLLARMAKGGG